MGGTAFSGKPEKQADHDYYALVDAAGVFIHYVSKQEISTYCDRIRLGKKIAKLDRAIARCSKRITEYKAKLPPVEQVKPPAIAAPSSLSRPQDNQLQDSGVGEQENEPYATVESAAWSVSEAA